MKTFRLILALAAVALTAVSCVEKSGKYQTLLAQRDSLLTVEQKYDQTLEILNEIETGFQSIREVEDRVMTQISDIENKPLDKKQQMVSQINQIKGILLQNKERIAELEAQFAQSGRKNASLAGTIKRLQEEMTRKVAQIESLQTELSQKNIEIEELAGTVEELNKDIAGLNEVTASQKTTIEEQDSQLNVVWFCIRYEAAQGGSHRRRQRTLQNQEHHGWRLRQIGIHIGRPAESDPNRNGQQKAQAAHLAPQRELHAHTGRRQTGNARNHRSRKILEHIEIPGHSEINRFRQTEYPCPNCRGIFHPGKYIGP